MSWGDYGSGWAPYVSVAERRQKAMKELARRQKKGLALQPVLIEGRKIARTFWGESWCQHLESFSDYSNRLPRGRTYVRNGSVCHLEIAKSKITAVVSGSEPYDVSISIAPLAAEKWSKVKQQCAGHIASLLELLQGKFSSNVMRTVTDKQQGLFPLPSEIKLKCSCPDSASMCKHLAAVLYGVGSRLDTAPELLFLLRAVDHHELIQIDAGSAVENRSDKSARRKRIADDSVEDLFGIEMLDTSAEAATSAMNTITLLEPSTRTETTISTSRRSRRSRNGGIRPGAAGATALEKKAAKTPSPAIVTEPAKASRTKSSTPVTAAAETAKKAPALVPSPAAAARKSPDVKVNKRSTFTGDRLRALRHKFDMSQVQFATLLEVSAASIGKWEREATILSLRANTLACLQEISKLSKTQAWDLLG